MYPPQLGRQYGDAETSVIGIVEISHGPTTMNFGQLEHQVFLLNIVSGTDEPAQ